jgi:transcriptional antiterminator RfaH
MSNIAERAADQNRGGAPAWYALHVKAHKEHQVHDHLTSKSIPAFLPLVENIRCGRTRRAAVLEPLFPGYLFVHIDSVASDPRCWQTVRWTPGVRLILGTDATPVPIPPEAVEAIQERVRERGFACVGISFQPRSRVRFRTGPWTGLEAVFERPMSRSGRVRVLMTLLGRQTGLEVDALDLEDA